MKISISRIIAWAIEILGLLYLHQSYIADPSRSRLITSIFGFCFCIWQVESYLRDFRKNEKSSSKNSMESPILSWALFVFVLALAFMAFWGGYKAYLREDTIATLLNVIIGFVLAVALGKSLQNKD